MSSGYTKGPWYATDFCVEAVHPEYNDGNGMTVLAFVTGYFGDRNTQRSNARLIAAAPDGLALALYAVDNPDFDSQVFDRMAREFIAKATGAAP
jgi:hypothetical protein